MPRAHRTIISRFSYSSGKSGRSRCALDSQRNVSDLHDLKLRPAHEEPPVAGNPGGSGDSTTVGAVGHAAGVMPFSGTDTDDSW